MTTNARAAVAKRAQQTGQVQPGAEGQQSLAAFVNSEGVRREIARAVPAQVSAERIARIALTSLRTVKHLAECTQDSFAGALMTCAQLGLEPGGATGEAYLVPFFNRKIGRYEVQLIVGYAGMVRLFWQSPLAKGLDARVVKENDDFDYEYGLHPFLKHKPARSNRGKSIAYYAVARTTSGGEVFLVLYIEDIEQIRTRSRAKDDGPWKTDYDAMAKKTCIRQLFKTLPKSPELAQAVAQDGAVRTDWSRDAIDAPVRQLDGAPAPIRAPDPDTGEVIEAELEPETGWADTPGGAS